MVPRAPPVWYFKNAHQTLPPALRMRRVTGVCRLLNNGALREQRVELDAGVCRVVDNDKRAPEEWIRLR